VSMIEISQEPAHLTLIGFDPGTINFGYAKLTMTTQGAIVSATATTIKADKLELSEWIGKCHGPRFQRISALGHELTARLIQDDPTMIACEAPFYNALRPSAFAPLVETLAEVRRAVITYDIKKPIYLVSPASAKKAIGVKDNKQKDSVRQAILAHAELYPIIKDEVEDMDEHSIDALAVVMALRNLAIYGSFTRLGEFLGI